MKDSDYKTLNVNQIGSKDATTLVSAALVPLRVLVTNVGPVMIFVSKASNDVAPTPTTASYRVFPGDDKVFVIAAKQSLYAIGAGLGGLMSVTHSEALPESASH
jgi:hypothetical protein